MELMTVEMGETYRVRLDYRAPQNLINKQWGYMREAGATFDPKTRIYTLTPSTPREQVLLNWTLKAHGVQLV